ncbi:MAG: DUF1570 domain-containing protein, partial [Planctomycetales bacterium]|nr:DUF1570 domain-containing protein [Planctomycetales bacterium]
RPLPTCVLLAAIVFAAGRVPSADAIDLVQLKRDGRTLQVAGELVVEAQDGGLLLRAADGVLWAVPPEEIVTHETNERPFVPDDAAALAKSLVDELGDGFAVHQTAHYVIAYNTSRAYAQWCGALYERLYQSYFNYWERRGVELVEPPQPLVAVVFDSKAAYVAYARRDLGDSAGAIIGYYNLQSNRVAMYDLASASTRGDRLGTMAQVNEVLAQPQATTTVATIIHEATHQLAFNTGVHQRLADIPLWLSEGFAMYFETPDLSSAKGWRTIGAVNRPRLVRFRQSLRSRRPDALETMLASDDQFRDPKAALDAYAQAWALNYFLIQRYPEQYTQYLKVMAAKGPLLTDTPETRLNDFDHAFGKPAKEIDAEFLAYLRRLN